MRTFLNPYLSDIKFLFSLKINWHKTLSQSLFSFKKGALIEFCLITQIAFLYQQTMSQNAWRKHFNKLHQLHVHARAAPPPVTRTIPYSLQVNFNPFYRLHQKSELRWKFHEHALPLNLRISFSEHNIKKTLFSQLFAYVFAQPEHVVSHHVSRLFLKFREMWNFRWGEEQEGPHHHAKFTSKRGRSSAVFLRAGYNMFRTCTPWFSCF